MIPYRLWFSARRARTFGYEGRPSCVRKLFGHVDKKRHSIPRTRFDDRASRSRFLGVRLGIAVGVTIRLSSLSRGHATL